MNKSNLAIIEAFKKGYDINKDGEVFGKTGKKLSLFENKATPRHVPYLRFSIRLGKESFKVKVHQFQAYKKFGDKIFDSRIQVRHLNTNSLDNSWDNIAIGTQEDNCKDKKCK